MRYLDHLEYLTLQQLKPFLSYKISTTNMLILRQSLCRPKIYGTERSLIFEPEKLR